MPRKKTPKSMRAVHPKHIMLGWFDLAVLEYTQQLNPLFKQIDIFREALASYLKADPAFDPEDFRAYVEDLVREDVPDEDHKRHVMRMLEQFLNTTKPKKRRPAFRSSELIDRRF